MRSVINNVKNTEQAKITYLAADLAKKIREYSDKNKNKNIKKLNYLFILGLSNINSNFVVNIIKDNIYITKYKYAKFIY